MGKLFEAIQIGNVAQVRHLLTEDDVQRFVALTGDDNRLHVDRDYARGTSLKGPVAHGMLGASFISTAIGTKLPGDGALWYAQKLEFLLPVRIGDEIVVEVEVLRKIEQSQSVELRTDIFNQNRQKVTTGTAMVKILDQVEPEVVTERAPSPGVALIVGATGGIGRATCVRLAEDGYDVVVHYRRNREGANEVRKVIETAGRRAICVQADITNEQDVKELVDVTLRRFGTVSALVNCAAARLATLRIDDVEWSDVEAQLALNLKSNVHLLRAVRPVMERQGFGQIVYLTTQAVEAPNPGWLPYITAKSALQGFARALAVELAPRNIRVNLVSPGMTDTELIMDIPEKVRIITAARTPLRRLATPADVAGSIGFLVSDRAAFLTGETIRVNGGQVMI